MKTLAQAGHEVYVISPFPIKEAIPNYHDVTVENGSDGLWRKKCTNIPIC